MEVLRTLSLGLVRLKFVLLVVGMAISLDLVGLGMAHTTVSTVNESFFVINKEVCGLHVVSMYFRFSFFLFILFPCPPASPCPEG